MRKVLGSTAASKSSSMVSGQSSMSKLNLSASWADAVRRWRAGRLGMPVVPRFWWAVLPLSPETRQPTILTAPSLVTDLKTAWRNAILHRSSLKTYS